MKTYSICRKPWLAGVSVLALMASANQAQSAITIEVDMDPVPPGIQDTHVGGGAVTATLWLVMGAGDSLTDYSVSARIDAAELAYAAPSAEPAAPLGFGLDAPAPLADTVLIVPGFHQTGSFDAGTFAGAAGAPLLGPSSTLIGTMSFTVVTPIDDGAADVDPAFWVFGIDAVIDGPLTPAVGFRPGYVTPEPSTTLLLGLGSLLFLRRKRR